jgi:peroxiredoxin (alkyl hydroperoxide reductase subunit C)
MSIGRSVEELRRVLAALQTADEDSVATPEGWQPGDATMLPPPVDQAEAELRTGKAWYYTMTGEPS